MDGRWLADRTEAGLEIGRATSEPGRLHSINGLERIPVKVHCSRLKSRTQEYYAIGLTKLSLLRAKNMDR